ncbi:hypothetical protein Nepgr_002778 [Nepenthes gracilis]|uniref:Uncharacterized protein n=1 Tax=Nepenthes gracilis TaxID=150966 RepID=A0AAD3PA18_NEPGR|nr:hypothetical protein Nepgr_002778 [Nepenthes gracilis]
MNFKTLLFLFIVYSFNFSLILTLASSFTSGVDPNSHTSILFNSVGRANYGFDIYTLPSLSPPSNAKELKITDGVSVNFNGYFPNQNSSARSFISQQHQNLLSKTTSAPSVELVYVTERNGISGVNYVAVYCDSVSQVRSRSAVEIPTRVEVQLLPANGEISDRISMKDRPSLVGENLIYVSTHEDSGAPRASWAAVYSTHLGTRLTRRLTPKGLADFSPSVSPSGVWTAVASFGERGWDGEVEELRTDIYVFLTGDGSRRVKVVEHGGWPCWVDDYTIYFHRRSDEDGWWSVYRATLPRVGRVSTESVAVKRVTPPGLHVFTPATSSGNKEFIAVATRRPESDYRHIELFDLVRNEFREVTRSISPQTHHFNPFLSSDSTRIGYHKCRDASNEKQDDHLVLQNLENPIPGISLFRVDGSFPSFSPTGSRIAYVKLPGLYVMDRDGSNQRQVFKGLAFPSAWDPVREGVIYTSTGPIFATESSKVDIISINIDEENITYTKLTEGGENNAFPSPSPDGKWVVFRSGRSGHKNLYIIDAQDGEKGAIWRLTEGPWTDTMCNWSPSGEWIVFASDRDSPGSGHFELYRIHPNGTGLRKVIQNGSGGRVNHPWFSPDGRRIVFTSDHAGVSAEVISTPHQFQPYGEIFVANLDGSDIQRLTHNSYEDGTPTWGRVYIEPADVAKPIEGPGCTFDDCHWLSTKPNHGLKGAPIVPTTTRVQCV